MKEARQNKYILYYLIYTKLRKYKLNYSDRRQISHCLGTRAGMGKDGREGLQRGMKKLMGVMEMLIILSTVMAS